MKAQSMLTTKTDFREKPSAEARHRVEGGTLAVWFDGGCPLCTREVAILRRLDRFALIHFEDISQADSVCPIDRAQMLVRFHAQEKGAPIVSGAAAFAVIWRAIPVLRPLGELAKVPAVLWTLERLYLGFLRVRPLLQRMIRWVERRGLPAPGVTWRGAKNVERQPPERGGR
jgi:predicted DCC family thiol-disulfide oxidoreductase YuxK